MPTDTPKSPFETARAARADLAREGDARQFVNRLAGAIEALDNNDLGIHATALRFAKPAERWPALMEALRAAHAAREAAYGGSFQQVGATRRLCDVLGLLAAVLPQ